MPGGRVKKKAAKKALRAMDRRFSKQGGAALQGWLQSADRAQLCLTAGTQAARLAKARYDEYTTGVNPQKLAREVGRQLRKQAKPDPFGGYLLAKAVRGDKAAGHLLDQLGGPGAAEVRDYAEAIRKSGQAGEARRLAESVLEDIEKGSMTHYLREQALRKE
jgi:hypothetical protein